MAHARFFRAATLFVALGTSSSLLAQEAGGVPPSPDADPQTLPEVRVEGDPVLAPEAVFPPLPPAPMTPMPSILNTSVFATPRTRGYGAETTTTGTFVNVPVLEVPASVSVVTQDLIRDQQALRLDDIFRDVPGASKLGDQLRPDTLLLRGFEVRSQDYRKNGMRDPTYTPRDLANVERVEILKGPASVLYGSGQPAGTVNIITKKPIDDDFATFATQLGNYGLDRYTIDANGAIGDDRAALFRINMAYENRDSFRDFGFNERVFISPALTFILDEDTSITWEGEYLKDRRRFDTGIAAFNGNIDGLPIDRFLGEPGNDFQLYQDWRQSVFLDHRFNDVWTMRLMATSLFYHAPSSGTFPLEQDPGTSIYNRSRQNIPEFFESYHGLTANLSGEFLTGNIEHKLLLGTEQGWFISNNFLSESSLPGLQNFPIDGLNPVYTNPQPFILPADFESAYRVNRHGVYAQDVMKFSENWSAMAGLRYDRAHVDFVRELTTFGIPTLPLTDSEQTFDRWTPRVGLVYQPLPDVLSIYGSYSRSFDVPPGGPRLTNDPLSPELGESWEIGTKWQMRPNLIGQVAWFWIQKDNYTLDLTSSSPPFFVTTQAGSLTSQGVELSLQGQITERWSTSSQYTLTDAVLRDSVNTQFDDTRPRNVPRHLVNLWTRYNVIQEEDRTLGGGLGMLYVDDRLAAFGGDLRLPDYTRWDAGLFYRLRAWDFALYFENLLDNGYYASAVNDMQISPGAPFTVRGMVSVTF